MEITRLGPKPKSRCRFPYTGGCACQRSLVADRGRAHPAGKLGDRRSMATVGLTVLEQAGMAMWDQLKALGLVEYGDQFIVKDILSPD
jgi:hypothetical protein